MSDRHIICGGDADLTAAPWVRMPSGLTVRDDIVRSVIIHPSRLPPNIPLASSPVVQGALHKNPDFSTVFCAGADSAQKVNVSTVVCFEPIRNAWRDTL